MLEVEKLKAIHYEFLTWLNSKENIPNISDYISYAEAKLDLFEKYSQTHDVRVFKSLTISLNRYRDEFNFDLESFNQSYVLFERMDEIINN